MPRKRRKLRTKVTEGRPRMSDAMEAFLAGDDSVFEVRQLGAGLLSDLISEKTFAECTERIEVEFSERESRRFQRLEDHYREIQNEADHARYRKLAGDCKVLNRYKILISKPDYRECPSRAWTEAIGPGPNSEVRNVPQDGQPKGETE
jgi:hypothetical protein